MPSVRAWILIGVALRAALLLLSAPIELQSDEAHYAWLGLGWERFDYLTDSQRFLWPPAYPLLHKVGFQLFQQDGVTAVRALQVSMSIATGWGIAALAKRFVSERASRLAVGLWALHFPLAGFCSLGWPDSIFLALLLPGLALLHDGARDSDQLRLLFAGLLLGVSALFKEIGLVMAALSACWLARHLYSARAPKALPASLTFALATFLPLAPWTARNIQHYRTPIPSGKTLGENIYHGWNSTDRNFDVLPVARAADMKELPETASMGIVRSDDAVAWERPGGRTLNSRDAAKISNGIDWALAHPAEWARTRLGKAAHMSAPVSFPVRNLALGNYGGPLADGLLGRLFLLICTLQSLALVVLGAAALARRPSGHALFWIPTVVFLAQPLLVGMSRLRVPLTPFLLIAIAGAITEPSSPRSRAACALAGLGACLLILIDHRPVIWLLQQAWQQT